MAPTALESSVAGLSLTADTVVTSKNGSSPSLLQSYSSFQSTPSIGTEFRALSNDGKPTLSIREVLRKEILVKELGQLV